MDYHAHAILDLMEGREFTTASLIATIREEFGVDATFHTCSVEGKSAEEIVEFLQNKNKFIDTPNGFTVNTANRCSHH
ncbi:MAG: YecH family protein [Bacteroidaceae bacterium]|nr:YecH family protein [Bacteroidaceae bacterium]